MNARDTARPGGHGRGAGKKPGHGRRQRGGRSGARRGLLDCSSTVVACGLFVAFVAWLAVIR